MCVNQLAYFLLFFKTLTTFSGNTTPCKMCFELPTYYYHYLPFIFIFHLFRSVLKYYIITSADFKAYITHLILMKAKVLLVFFWIFVKKVLYFCSIHAILVFVSVVNARKCFESSLLCRSSFTISVMNHCAFKLVRFCLCAILIEFFEFSLSFQYSFQEYL